MPFERGKVLRRNGVEIPSNMKVDGRIRKRRQEDELNSEKCGAGGPLGKTLSNRPRNRCIGRQFVGRRTLEFGLKEVEAGGNGVQNPESRQERVYYL